MTQSKQTNPPIQGWPMNDIGTQEFTISAEVTLNEALALRDQTGRVFVLTDFRFNAPVNPQGELGVVRLRFTPGRGLALLVDEREEARGGISVVSNSAEEQKGRDLQGG